MSVTLICYFAVSSVAAVHAFPPSLPTTGASQVSPSLSLANMNSNCHQQKSNEIESSVIGSCKIFCASMSNIIIDELVTYLPVNDVSKEMIFLVRDVSTLAFDMEPHPPK
jgi:hypothetical protein